MLRNKKNGEIISLAPNFDNNLALISRSEILNVNAKNDGFISVFIKFLKNNTQAYNLYKEIKLPKVTKKIVQECFNQIDIKVNEKMIMDYILNRYDVLRKI